jgi:hypothetical protein
MAIFGSVLLYGLGAILGLLVLDRALPMILGLLKPILPDEICGPRGWLLDSENGRGVFDFRR